MNIHTIVTHPGGAHKDDFLACCLLVSATAAPVVRREPTPEDLADAGTAVVDVGDRHDPASGNFDHHHFPADHPPVCALSLVLQHLGLYEDAREFCDWLEPAEWFDARGPNETARWLGTDRATLAKLQSPVDVTLLRRFAAARELAPDDPLWQVMRWIGDDLLAYLRETRARLDFIGRHSEMWRVGGRVVLFLPRTEPLPDEPSAGLWRFIAGRDEAGEVAAMVYPDRRGSGYALARHNDDAAFDFTRVGGFPDVHFAHARGFVAKTSANAPERLRELLQAAATC